MAASRNPSYLAPPMKSLYFQPDAFMCVWAGAEVRLRCVWECVLDVFGSTFAGHSVISETQVQ
eukprot:9709720-Heterocapsa_arctica.AAC.1